MKLKLLSLVLTLCLSVETFSQITFETYQGVTPENFSKPFRPTSNNKNANCNNDTLFYSFAKEFILGNDQYNTLPLLTGSAGFPTAISQTYLTTVPSSIQGISFYARVMDAINPSQTVSLNVSVYNVNANNIPTTVISTANVTAVGTGVNMYSVNFVNPVTTLGNYAVVVENPSTTDTVRILCNNAKTTSIYHEGLSFVQVTPNSWYSVPAAYGAPNAFEPIIAPVVSYSIATDYTVSGNPVCAGIPMSFTNQTTPGFLTNRMYSFNSFLDHFNLTVNDSTFEWDFGDGSVLKDSINAYHTYMSTGTFTSKLTTSAGFWNSCMDVDTYPIAVEAPASASFTSNSINAPTVAFTNTSTSGNSYVWDFGDGSPIDITTNPSHTYTNPGTYTATLITTTACNSDTATEVISITSVGIAGASFIDEIKLYPNPTNGILNMQLNTPEKINIEILNVLGEVVYANVFSNTTSTSIDITHLSKGVYYAKISTSNGVGMKQITVVK